MKDFQKVLVLGRAGSGTLADGYVSPLNVDASGNVFVVPFSSDTQQKILNQLTNVDNQSFGAPSIGMIGIEYNYNGSSFDRVRNNIQETILASAARTASTNSADFVNYNGKGAHFIVDVTAVSGSASITATIQGKDPVSGNYYDLLTSNAIVSVETNVLKIYPGSVAIANHAANDILPRIYRVSVAHATTDSITYSVGANLNN